MRAKISIVNKCGMRATGKKKKKKKPLERWQQKNEIRMKMYAYEISDEVKANEQAGEREHSEKNSNEMNLKMFFAFGCTIKVFSTLWWYNMYMQNTRLRTIFFIRISISIGLIGIYNKEELIALFVSMHICTATTQESWGHTQEIAHTKMRRNFLMNYPAQ